MLGSQHWKKMLCLVYVLLCWFVFSSGEIRTCSVNRRRFGDRIHANPYPKECSKSVNPCKQVSSAWRNLGRNCTCVCWRKLATYREDLGTCARNEDNRGGCNLFFQGEVKTSLLRVFNNSSSLKLKNPPRGNCSVPEDGTSYVDVNGWTPLNVPRPPFAIQRGRKKQAQFLVWNGAPVPQLFGRIVKVAVQCRLLRGSAQTLPKLCIVFKVEGSTSLLCPFQTSTPSSPTTTISTPLKTHATVNVTTQSTSNETVSPSPGKPVTDIATITFPTSPPSARDDNKKQAADTGEPEGLPLWLIGVLAGAAVVAILVVTVIIWMCCKMKRRSRSKKKTGLQTCNPHYHRGAGTMSTFAPAGGGQGTDEAGYTRIGSPTSRNGYAQLKPLPHRTSTDYQRLLKPGEDPMGYLIPLEQRGNSDHTRADVYTEPGTGKTQRRPKSKDYDYAKPDGMACADNTKPFIVIQPTRNTCNLVNASGADPNDEEAGYVGTRVYDASGDDNSEPASPIYKIVEGPGSPPKYPQQTTAASGLEDPQSGYIEVLPETETQNDCFASKQSKKVET